MQRENLRQLYSPVVLSLWSFPMSLVCSAHCACRAGVGGEWTQFFLVPAMWRVEGKLNTAGKTPMAILQVLAKRIKYISIICACRTMTCDMHSSPGNRRVARKFNSGGKPFWSISVWEWRRYTIQYPHYPQNIPLSGIFPKQLCSALHRQIKSAFTVLFHWIEKF